MKKKILLIGFAFCMLFAFAACGEKKDSSTESVAASDVESSMGDSTSDLPTPGEHNFTLVPEKAGTCNAKSEIAHYVCSDCGKKVDLTMQDIESVEGDYDFSNHVGTTVLSVTSAPSKIDYKVGETFDPTGMVIVYLCGSCQGETLDNQFLTYAYQTEGATAFSQGDTKVTVQYNGLSFDIAISVQKLQAEISGLQEAYETVCGVAPIIDVTTNVPECPVTVTYFDGETEVTAEELIAGKTYTAKLSIAETEGVRGTEASVTLNVAHGYTWVEDEADWHKLSYACACGDVEEFYAMQYQSPYVDEDDLGIDLSKFVFGAENVTIQSVQKITRQKGATYVDAKDGEVGAIEYTNEGSVYTFSAEEYEKPAGNWKPFILTLLVDYVIDGVECPVVVEAKLVDKLIKESEDLKELAYTGAAQASKGGTAVTKYYVLMKDIDASDVVINSSTPAFENEIGFRGVLEGNGYTISNLAVSGGQGLFGAIGDGGKIQNVNFTNVSVVSGNYALAFAMRKATLENVSVEFSPLSQSYYLSGEANSCTYNNVRIVTDKTQKLFINMDGIEEYTLPETLNVTYFKEYTVSFDTDGAGELASVTVVDGRTLLPPKTPEKTSAEYNYEFLGWYNGEMRWDFNTPITSDMTLVASWKEIAKTTPEDVITAIDALPETVTMPAQIYHVPAITKAQALYGELLESERANVTNYAKLEGLLKGIKGYETVYVPNETGIKAIPAALHNPNPTVGVTGALSTDATYGATFKATAGEGGKAAIQFANFPSVEKYTKLYFYVKSSASGKIYMADGAINDGWGANWKGASGISLEADAWTLVSVEVSSGIVVSDWVVSIWATEVVNESLEIGAVIGYAEVPVTEAKTEVSLEWGNRVDSGETNEYGKIYNLSREQYYIDQNNTGTMGTLQAGKLAAALPAGYEYLTFWVYNPTEAAQNFHLAGDVSGNWTDSKDTTVLAAKAWTKVVISQEDIQLNKNGQWYVYIGSSDASGWKISTTYAAKAE